MAEPRNMERTKCAVVQVCHDLHAYVRSNPLRVQASIYKLIDNASPEALASRYLDGMPELVQSALRNDKGIDLEDLAILADDISCSPNSITVSCYFVFGLPEYEEDDIPMRSPIYSGETAAHMYGMSGRTDVHLDPLLQANEPGKLLYQLLDSDEAPMQLHALVITRSTLVDKAWTRFRELITRQLLRTNVNNKANEPFIALDSHAALNFKQPVEPTNRKNVLKEGRHDENLEVNEFADRHAAYEKGALQQREANREDARYSHTCIRCGVSDSLKWHRDKEHFGEYTCGRCYDFHCHHGRFPDAGEFDNREAKYADITARTEVRKQYECPNVCENPNCRSTESHGHWLFDVVRMYWVCGTCNTYSRQNNGELRVPRRSLAATKEHPWPGQCENPICKSQKGRHKFNMTRNIWLCDACDAYARLHDNELRPFLNMKTAHQSHACPNVCENTKCGATTTSKRRWSKIHDMWLCGACSMHVDRKGNDGSLPDRQAKKR